MWTKFKYIQVKHCIFLLIAASSIATLYGQAVPTTTSGSPLVFTFSREIEDQLPNLDSLQQLARLFSPMMQKFTTISKAQQQKIELAKKSWSQHLQLQGNYAIGNQSLLLSGSTSTDINQLSNGYRFGVNLGFPIFDLLSRNNRIKLAKAEALAAEEQVDEAGLLVDKEVVTFYFQLTSYFRQLRTAIGFSEKAAVSEELARKRLDGNQIPLADFTRIAEIRAIAESRKFDAERNFFEAFFSLQAILGVPLESLRR